jgi:hypothetical protein
MDDKEARALVAKWDGVNDKSWLIGPDLRGHLTRALDTKDQMTAAMTLIERVYYMEGKSADWRASRMNSIARDAQNGSSLEWAERLFPRNAKESQL